MGQNLAGSARKDLCHPTIYTNKNKSHFYAIKLCFDSTKHVTGDAMEASAKCTTVETRLLYDRKEAARQLSISVRSLDYLIAGKQLETRRIGRKVLVTRASLVRYSAGNHYAITSRSDADAVASGDKCA